VTPKTPIHRFEQCCWDLRGVLTRFGPDQACCDGLTPRQCRILRAVGSEPDLRLSEIAKREGLTPGGLTRRIQPLLEGEWLRRPPLGGEPDLLLGREAVAIGPGLAAADRPGGAPGPGRGGTARRRR